MAGLEGDLDLDLAVARHIAYVLLGRLKQALEQNL